MRHQKTRHKLSRDAAHRKALLANLCIEVIDHERIKTTEAKAKAVKPEIEQLITLAKKGDLHARRQAMSTLQHPDKGVIYKLFEEIAPRYADRPGGYTRITKLGPRKGDNAPMVKIELVEALADSPKAKKAAAKKSAPAKKAAAQPAEEKADEPKDEVKDEDVKVEETPAADVQDVQDVPAEDAKTEDK
jgi:large subunit ribosomal protein L17